MLKKAEGQISGYVTVTGSATRFTISAYIEDPGPSARCLPRWVLRIQPLPPQYMLEAIVKKFEEFLSKYESVKTVILDTSGYD